MKNDKVKAVKEWKTSTKIKEVESFLEFANFHKYCIKNFNYTTKSLNEIKGKKNWKWKEDIIIYYIEHYRRFWNNDVISHVNSMQYICPFRVGQVSVAQTIS